MCTRLPIKLDDSVFNRIGKIADHRNIDVYVVGGYVRDLLLGKKVKDIDFVIVGDGPNFAKCVAGELETNDLVVYKNFGTAMIKYNDKILEFVGARAESYSTDSRKPHVQSADLFTDLSRRDFTINAIAIALNENNYGTIIDPFNGRQDLTEKIIRTPLAPQRTFYDDPLRIMRAIRFATVLNFKIDETTLAGLEQSRDRLTIISQERITDELNKILCSHKPSRGFHLLDHTGVLELILPELVDLKGIEKIGKYGHKDVFKHTLQVLDNVAKYSSDLKLRYTALFHDIAKPLTKEFKPSVGWTFHGHEDLGAKMFVQIGKRLRLSNELLKYGEKLIQLHLRPIHLAEEGVTDSAIRRLIFKAGEDIDDLITLCRADITSANPQRVVNHLANFDIVVERIALVEEKDRLRQFQPPVNGDEIMRHFNLKPGPLVGKIKSMIEEAILNGEIPNEHDSAFKFMISLRDAVLDSDS
ncbi:HD domain-containing protein [candidate division KSB1 bacterium]|nr:HD domain-containing protein [candidate division KSB1 bacterium]